MLDTHRNTHTDVLVRGVTEWDRALVLSRAEQSDRLREAWARMHPEQRLALLLLMFHGCDEDSRAALVLHADHEARNAVIFRP